MTKIFGIDLNSTGISNKLQPTVGFSFGLPNGQNQYGGQPQNFLGTGSSANPYPAQGGLSIGAVDVSPLVSFQATTNDDGEIVHKPLINLHVTPNGCGLFGCDNEFQPSFQDNFFGTRRQSQKQSQRPVSFEQLTPSPVYNPPRYPSNPYQKPQYQSQNQYQYQNQRPYQRPHQNRPNKVRFGNDDQKEVVVKHEHHHFHHHNPQAGSIADRYNDNGIRFGYEQNYDGPYFRTLNDTLEEDNQVKKRNTAQLTFEGEEEKNAGQSEGAGFKFPNKSGRKLEKRSAQDSQDLPAVTPVVDIQPVGKTQNQAAT